jgi:tetratricopeptide (TPR) repeat protein
MRMTGHELLARGEFEPAAAAYRQAIALYQQYSPDERDVRTVEPYLGWAMIEAGDDLAARPLLENACDFWKGRQESRYARALCFLSTHFLRRGNSEQAIPLLRQALIAIEKTTSDLPWPVRPQVSLTLARALLMAGEKEEALSHAQWAYDCYKRMGHFLCGASAFWLGKVYEGFHKPALSDRFYQEARLRWTDLGLEHLLKRL